MSLINMLPDDYVHRQKQRRMTRLCILLLVIVVLGVAGAALVSQRNYRITRQVSEDVNASYQEANRLIQQMQELEGSRGQMLEKAKLTAGLLERVPRSFLLATLTEAMPEGCSLATFELTSKKKTTLVITKDTKEQMAKQPPKPAESANDVTVTVTGLAGTDVEVARFIAAVAKCELVDTVDLVYSEQKKFQDQVVREFQVVLTLKSDADVRKLPLAANTPQADRLAKAAAEMPAATAGPQE